nr:hypothetical protein [Marinicella sp. W31]MDC2880268.1 hypothetical protein [Marinicella sp. W31]
MSDVHDLVEADALFGGGRAQAMHMDALHDNGFIGDVLHHGQGMRL